MICEIGPRCIDEPAGECFEECLVVSEVLDTELCASLWFELGICVMDAPCEVISEDGLEFFCAEILDALETECGLSIGDGGPGMGGGGMSGGGSGGSSGGDPDG